ncbi:MAG: hypothetical protein EOL87_07755 [Spartobacteria bacterium]|nr:hypothetical protein [Spartobacteria bacterium]
MKKTTHTHSIDSLSPLIKELQHTYADAFEVQDLKTLIESSGGLCVAYAAAGVDSLAEKWMDEYLNNMKKYRPEIFKKMRTIRSLLPEDM